MTWGDQNSQEEAFEQLDYAFDHGINFIDTAEIYPVPIKKETSHKTETIIGNYTSAKKNRDKFILASKVTGRASHINWLRNGNHCFDKKNIQSAVEDSLTRLQTDYIDLYQLHWPDRKTNFFGQLGFKTPQEENSIAIEETLLALEKLIKQGKIRFIGISNETPWGFMKFLQIAKELNLSKIVSIQNPYSLLNRTFEVGLAEISHREKVGLLAYSPLAFGVLSGKYLNKQMPENSRMSIFPSYFNRYISDLSQQATQQYVELAQEYNLDSSQMAISFVLAQPYLTSAIIGATSLEQLEKNIHSHKINLPKELMKKIDKIHNMIPNPAP